MKKTPTIFIAILVIASAISSCKKDAKTSPTTSATSMKLTSNGTVISFNTAIEVTATVNNVDHLIITGENITGTKVGDENFELEIIHPMAELKAGQSYSASANLGSANSAALYYSPNATDTFNTQPGSPQGTVNITSVTTTTITGTFSGKLFAESDFSGTTLKYTITSGSFTASITK